MIATVAAEISVATDEMSPAALRALKSAVTFDNPAYAKLERMGRWTGDTPEEVTLYTFRGGRVCVPRGAWGAVTRAARVDGVTVEWRDERVVLGPHAWDFGWTLRDYQSAAVAALVKRKQGTIVAPCGAGKTVMGVAAIAQAQQPALVIVHTHDLLDQWRATIGDALGVEAGTIGGGTWEIEPVTVATVQTLVKASAAQRAEVAASFGAVVVDESHHAPADTFRDVLSWLPARYRFGLTATPTRADGLDDLIPLCVGSIVHEVKHKELVKAGHLIVPKVVAVPTGFTFDGDEYSKIINAACADVGRNEIITDLVVGEAKQGHSVLVLSGRVDHCQRLAELLTERGVQAEAITSKVSKKKRARLLDEFRAGDLPVACATSLADEGLDVSRLERLVLATSSRSEPRTIQRLGRLMRPHPGKGVPVLYDLVDDHGMLKNQYYARRRAYRKVLGVG